VQRTTASLEYHAPGGDKPPFSEKLSFAVTQDCDIGGSRAAGPRINLRDRQVFEQMRASRKATRSDRRASISVRTPSYGTFEFADAGFRIEGRLVEDPAGRRS
jgi:hypothetical protein